MTREEMVKARDEAATMAYYWHWCSRIRRHDEQLRDIWEAEAKRARTPDPSHVPAVRRVVAWEPEFADVDEGDGFYWAFFRTEDDGTGKQCPEWFVVEVHHDRETDEPRIMDETIPEHAFEWMAGWGPRIEEPDHLVAPDDPMLRHRDEKAGWR